MRQESFNIEKIRKYQQDITDLKKTYHEKQQKYKNSDNKLLHASTSASFVGVISEISTIGTAITVVGIPISVSLGVVSTVSAYVGGILLLTSKKYKKKLLKCHELIDKIMSSLPTFEVLISLSLNDDSVIDAKEFLNPIAYGGRGRFLSHTTIVLAATLKPYKLWIPNFVTSCFFIFATI